MTGTSLADAISRDTTTQLAITLNIEIVVQNVGDVGVLENSRWDHCQGALPYGVCV